MAASQGIGVLLVEQHVHLRSRHAHVATCSPEDGSGRSGTAAELNERWAEVQASYLGTA